MANRGRCANCDDPLQIIVLKFRWNGTSTVWTCPNCAMVRPPIEESSAVRPGRLTFWRTGPLLVPRHASMDQQKAEELQSGQAIAHPITRWARARFLRRLRRHPL